MLRVYLCLLVFALFACSRERIVYVEVPAPQEQSVAPDTSPVTHSPDTIAVVESQPTSPQQLDFEQDREALMSFFNATNGPGWVNNTNWGSSNPDWHGVGVNGANVRSLSLPGNQVAGPIPPDIWKLRDLVGLNLSRNRLYGPIPRELGWFKKLWTINLSHNQLTGTIPDLIEYRGGGLLYGGFSDRAALRTLILSHNQLTDIPQWLSESAIDILYLDNNQLTGPLLVSSLPRYLKELALNDNQLSGALPPDLMELGWGPYGSLWLHNNQFTGEIPREWVQITKKMGGEEIPAEESFIRAFILPNRLTLSGNDLTGCIPPLLLTIRNHDLDQLNLPTCE